MNTTRKSISRATLWTILLVVALYALDQVTKWYVVLHFRGPDPLFGLMDGVTVLKDNGILNFYIVRVHNTGVAFGFGNGTTWAPFVFLGVQLVALVGLIVLYAKNFFSTTALKVAWAFIMTGVLGNMTDRLLQGFFLPGGDNLSFFEKLSRGYVVDFLDFSFPWLVTENFPRGYHWPSFNVADSCVCIAAGIFIVIAFFFDDKKKKASDASSAD